MTNKKCEDYYQLEFAGEVAAATSQYNIINLIIITNSNYLHTTLHLYRNKQTMKLNLPKIISSY